MNSSKVDPITQYDSENNQTDPTKRQLTLVLLILAIICGCVYFVYKKDVISNKEISKQAVKKFDQKQDTASIRVIEKNEGSLVELGPSIFYSKTTGSISIEKDIESLSIVNGDVIIDGKVVKNFQGLSGNNIVSINGNSVSIEGNGQSVSIINDVVYVNGKKVSPSQQKNNEEVLNKIVVNGSVHSFLKTVSHDVVVLGSVRNSVSTISGDIFASTINGSAETMSGDIHKIAVNSDFTGIISVKGSVGSLKTTSGNIAVKGVITGSAETMSGNITANVKGNTSTMSGIIY